jgi:hypothetical protein
MSNTANLILPYLDAAQAQKHVTHNASLTVLDAVTQLAVIARTVTAPPSSPSDGDRYLVAAGATGAWAGWDGNIAAYQSGAWAKYTPREGWLAWVAAETLALEYTGGTWQNAAGARSPHGACRTPRILEELLTLSGSSVTSVNSIPNGSICSGVSERVITGITGATSFSVGVAGNTTQFGNLLGIAAGSTNFGIIGPTAFYANTAVVLTAIGGAFTGGQVRLAIHIDQITPPQS